MRATFSSLIALTLFVSAVERAEAVTFTKTVVSDDIAYPNIMNFFLSPTGTTTFTNTLPSFLGGLDGGGATWTWRVMPGGTFAQLATTAPFGSLTEEVAPRVGFFQPGATQTAFTLDWQEIQYDWATNTVVGTFHTTVFNGLSAPPAGGPATLVGPVPEPTTFVILGFGAVLAGAAARRSRSSRPTV